MWASECQKHRALKAQICASLLSEGQIGRITILFNCAKSLEGNHSFVSDCRSFWVDSWVIWCSQMMAEIIFRLFGKGKVWKFWLTATEKQWKLLIPVSKFTFSENCSVKFFGQDLRIFGNAHFHLFFLTETGFQIFKKWFFVNAGVL